MSIIKVCANCKHFEILVDGNDCNANEKVNNSNYLISKCNINGWIVKEHYLLIGSRICEIKEEPVCEFWHPIKQEISLKDKLESIFVMIGFIEESFLSIVEINYN